MDFLNIVLKKKLFILIISLIFNLIFLSSTIYLGIKLFNKNNLDFDNENIQVAINDSNEEIKEDNNEKIYVEVKGAVKNPGVYEVTKNNIINDVINMSGGFNKNAYTKNINLSKRVSNELVIYIYTTSEYKKINTTNTTNNNENKNEQIKNVDSSTCDCNSYDISSCLNNKDSIIEANSNDTTTADDNTNNDNLVNINTATKEELLTINGIGESKAENIITYRNNCPFKSIEDIKKVNGIGDSIYEKIKDYITV